jgi:uncharacterized protein YbcI
MKSQGEIEALVCQGMARFEQEYMGRGPKHIHAYLIGDLLVVRLQGVLTAAEQQLVKTLPAEKGKDLLKQVRTQLIATARPVMEAMVQEVTGSKVVSVHHDISTATGEEVVLFTLAESPVFREAKKSRAPSLWSITWLRIKNQTFRSKVGSRLWALHRYANGTCWSSWTAIFPSWSAPRTSCPFSAMRPPMSAPHWTAWNPQGSSSVRGSAKECACAK